MKKIKQFIFAVAIMLGVGVFMLPAPNAAAVNVDPIGEACSDPQNANSEICKSKDDNIGDVMKTVINVLLFIVGAIAVVMIIVGGIMYATSAGDTNAVTRAKNTLTYAIVGLVIAFLAFAVVNWVVGIFNPPEQP